MVTHGERHGQGHGPIGWEGLGLGRTRTWGDGYWVVPHGMGDPRSSSIVLRSLDKLEHK